MTKEKIIEEFIEKGANLEHERWARWQEYMFSKFVEHSNGKGEYVCLSSDLFKRWSRQIKTPYSNLTEAEKESDRKETRNYIPLLEQALAQQKEEIKEMIEGMKLKFGKEHNRDSNCDLNYVNGYNQALTEILNKLTK